MGWRSRVRVCEVWSRVVGRFFFNDTATTEIYTLSLHDALPIWEERDRVGQHVQSLEKELGDLREHELWLRGEVGLLLESVLPPVEDAPGQKPEPDEVARSLTAGIRELARILAELSWRRGEMNAASGSARSLRARMAGGDLAQRARQWGRSAADSGQEVQG